MAKKGDSSLCQYLEMEADEALFGSSESPVLNGIIATFHENERPLRGLAGLLDWRFHGAISKYLSAGALTGTSGECAYLPMIRDTRVFHLLLLGCGPLRTPGERQIPDAKSIEAARRGLTGLRLDRIGVSRSDLGNVPEKFFSEQLGNLPLWVVS